MSQPLRILHVVRRYGPVGGMERYVWEVVRELATLGHHVEVLCERCHAEPPAGIVVYELGEIAKRPRWLSLLRFGARAENWLKKNPRPGFVIHSNERLGFHHITTFHGPPFATVRDKPWWKKLSLRIAMQFWLERRELATARHIVPNSIHIRKQLAHYYPEYAHKLAAPIVPGVAPIQVREWRPAPSDGGVVGFVGVEWQRKGLPFAAEIIKLLRRERPQIELWVVGPKPAEVSHLFEGWQGGYKLLGWRDDAEHLLQMDVLLHPARAEPFGMVISEAMAGGARVVVSDVCGAVSEIKSEAGAAMPLGAQAEVWAKAIDAQLCKTQSPPPYAHAWREVAQEYVNIYRQITDI
ncbi:MAG: glycosyltransferase family 4 protein [Gammaproteobacteria bacterium]|nr:glycosyltransferase family 4 protein [Gammaproteobacteria bacterium]MBU1624049.1 glycosyltransferase family 4 protein [Gammaproteobacteria bacterium]MBU1981777.1 glycosyltransferase family 4 protein [Gammaproteobacteria bacterium]